MSTSSTPHSPTVSIYILVLYYIFNPEILVQGFDVFILVSFQVFFFKVKI